MTRCIDKDLLQKFNMSVLYLDQDFTALRAECLKHKKLFCDPKFPAEPTSLGYKDLGPNSKNIQGVVWKRPGEICSKPTKPQFVAEEATRNDVMQGELGDCWLMAAIASLTLNQGLLRRIIFPEQNFTDNYAGIFHFLLWQYGKWVHVVVDDLLPTRDGKLLFVHSGNKSEFWTALLEKAYAKVNGSYEALSGGWANEALTDFTGGIGERYTLSEAPSDLFTIMKKAVGRGYPLSTSISGQGAQDREKKTSECLVKTHAYSVTGNEEVRDAGGMLHKLVRLRNPWGMFEWNGAWSDKSKEWDQILPEQKSKLAYSADDGEFWMSYLDFIKHFSLLQICNLTPDDPSESEGLWNYYEFEGTWKVGSTAGGCSNNKELFSTNPQFVVKLDIDSNKDQKCSVLVTLMQKNYRQFKQKGTESNSIGVVIYKLPEKYKGRSDVRLSYDDLKTLSRVGMTKFSYDREVCGRFKLSLGEYVLIPCTFNPNQEGSFLLRVFSEK
ncbi:calpain-2 catalytic subunit-like [Trichomycterus rosablanca]|uniref:calpain-2 catalytic subunit-like n=1 Tax=Trichomycterus rosablanca TaxID=2290929 RepID=UPI002F352F65